MLGESRCHFQRSEVQLRGTFRLQYPVPTHLQLGGRLALCRQPCLKLGLGLLVTLQRAAASVEAGGAGASEGRLKLPARCFRAIVATSRQRQHHTLCVSTSPQKLPRAQNAKDAEHAGLPARALTSEPTALRRLSALRRSSASCSSASW